MRNLVIKSILELVETFPDNFLQQWHDCPEVIDEKYLQTLSDEELLSLFADLT